MSETCDPQTECEFDGCETLRPRYRVKGIDVCVCGAHSYQAIQYRLAAHGMYRDIDEIEFEEVSYPEPENVDVTRVLRRETAIGERYDG